jgi:L-rhamnose isomerase
MSILSQGTLLGGGSGSGSGGGGGGLADAPSDGKVYGRRNSGWTPVESARHRHIQSSAADVWEIQHNLGSKPVALWTYLSDGTQFFGEPDYANATTNLLKVHFSEAVSGTAFVHTLI